METARKRSAIQDTFQGASRRCLLVPFPWTSLPWLLIFLLLETSDPLTLSKTGTSSFCHDCLFLEEPAVKYLDSQDPVSRLPS
ncbi:hypothetical protein EV361DRAFT_956626 [Lentinula raphanica]|nr:hypothetical protein F5880DRAFT_1619274 [Lentinula raphanica]KAJ3963779.1 hypothetical protein EV361DRAFT_956626 [Lentinula raphanica]